MSTGELKLQSNITTSNLAEEMKKDEARFRATLYAFGITYSAIFLSSSTTIRQLTSTKIWLN